ncbi:agmatine deiminase [Lewinella aquimaris]|uniref:Agmatine deiminase n=1 Tax=Neolewinella aquimaris TaxID=1835722 RepID=A0A840DX50_9BACT|nr:agmatine deiminase family protein [Neolewinella aquimaris]MBB4077794.1 agmatine deiminase [Neolewinella aquimaris]
MRRLPAEWESQQTVLLCFPRRGGDWGEVLDAASLAMVEAANRIHEACPVTLIVSDTEHFARFAPQYRGSILELPTDDSWIRDSGPITVFDDGPLLLDFTFNGWGGKFDARRDNQLPEKIQRRLFPDAAYRRVKEVLEGGSIESDGRGTILTTTRCLLSGGRNEFTDRQEAERLLIDTLGATRIIWLEHGELIGDDTDAHIDTVARFLDEGTVAYVGPPPPDDEQYSDFVAMRTEIHEKLADYRLVELPWTGTINSRIDGHRLPASYANFLISNGTLFLPTYGVPADDEAVAVLERESSYAIVPVDCQPFVEQHGALHCLTMQIPNWNL